MQRLFLSLPGLSVAFLLILNACSQKQTTQQQSLAANRIVGYSLRFTVPNVADDQILIQRRAFEKAIEDTYGSKLKVLNFPSGSLLEDPDNLYQIGATQADDIYILTVDLKPDTASITAVLYNGSNLKTVAVLKYQVSQIGEEPFEARYAREFSRVALEHFSNPNIYPKNNPIHFANLLLVYSQDQEKQVGELSCQNAETVLRFYPKIKELYEGSRDLVFAGAVGRQEETHQFTTRLQEATEKASLLEKCKEDKKKKFEVVYDFGPLDPSSHLHIRSAADTAKLTEIFKQYTDKPVTLKFSLEENSSLNLLVQLRFDPQRYTAWTTNRIPPRVKNFQIVSLDPYFAMMQRLVIFRASLPAEASNILKTGFGAMKMTLALETLMNGTVLVGVDGRYDTKAKSIAMAYPNSVYLQAPGFDSKLISNKDNEIFQQKAWLALGNCKTLDGTTTEDGLLLKFFGIPCS